METMQVRLLKSVGYNPIGSIVDYNPVTKRIWGKYGVERVDFTDFTRQLTNINRSVVEQAIKAQKWDKSSYVYACEHMKGFSYFDSYKKSELIRLFYELAFDNFYKIEHFTTFVGLNCYSK